MSDAAPLVLVVEDNPVNVALTTKVMQHLNLEVAVAEDGEMALEWCQTNTPRVILMDISLPGIDGLEVTRRLREMPAYADIPIIALTAHAIGGWEEKTHEAGCTAYLAKPVRPRDLMDTVTKFLEQ